MKVVFYTALFGGVDTLKEFDTGGYEFVAFTDTPVESKTWSVGAITEKHETPRLTAKFYKMHPRLVAGMVALGPDDLVIWIDASIAVTDVAKMASVCRRVLKHHDIAFFKHPERDNVYDELVASSGLPKYGDQPMKEQVEAYTVAGLPANHSLYAGGVIARRFGKTTALDEMWWEENKTRTIQDQLSLPYVLWKLDITPGVIPGSVYGTDFHTHTWAGPVDKPLSAMRTGEEETLMADEAPIPIESFLRAVSGSARPFISVVTPTHNPKWLGQAWESLKSQTHVHFEWLVSVNDKSGRRQPVKERAAEVKAIVQDDPRVRIVEDGAPSSSVGARKLFAFTEAAGEVLVELDHDDLLPPNALEEIAAAFKDPDIGFVYSDFADFVEGASTLQGNQTYRAPELRGGWMISGMTFYDEAIGGVRPGTYDCVRCQPPTARVVSHIYTAPNHVRAWRKSVYEAVGGHDPTYAVADDHELILRTYLATKFKHIPKPLYLYRIQGANTWAQNIPLIQSTTNRLQEEYVERLVLRECELLDVPAFDLGGGLYPRLGWTPVDKEFDDRVPQFEHARFDLTERPWPWKDGTVGAFRASDLLEHLPDKMQTMREIHRCLRSGGWLMSMTPSALGAGAFMDPTHCSYWVPGSFWYYTRAQQAQYIRQPPLFREVHLDTQQINIQGELVPYVRANLVKL